METSKALAISAVERETGISKETLRMWERRYAFPLPVRNDAGKRVYRAEEVSRLKLINKLLRQGHRPSKLMTLGMEELQALLQVDGSTYTRPHGFEQVVGWLKKADTTALKNWLITQIARDGLRAFLDNTLGPTLIDIGLAWKADRLRVHEEHLFSEAVQQTLRSIINNLPVVSPRPHILLTTPEGELHGLGLLVVESVLALDGKKITSLGVNTPVDDIALATAELDINIVIISMTSNYQTAQARCELIARLRQQLQQSVGLVVGGSGLENMEPIDNVLYLKNFDELLGLANSQ